MQESEVKDMYEKEHGTKRLVRALENTDKIRTLAMILNYESEQLEQDIKALADWLKEKSDD
jgi:hypothetical protein